MGRVPKTNAIETTTIELIKTDSDKVYITGTVNNIEPSVTKGPAMVKKDNSTEETTVEQKEKEENDETITANVKVESGPNPITCEADEYSAAEEVVAPSSNGKVSNEEPNALRMGGKSSIANKEIVKEPDPSSNREQVKELQSKAEKLVNTEDSESHTNEKEANIHPIKKEATTENKTDKSKGGKAITNKQQKQKVQKNPPHKHIDKGTEKGIVNPPHKEKLKEREVEKFI